MSYIGNTSTTQTYAAAVDYFSGDGSTTAFTLSKPVAATPQVQVVVNNVPQNPGSAFTVSGNTITFTSAPSTGTNNIYVYYTSPVTQVIAPSAGTVQSSSIASGGPTWDASGNLYTYNTANIDCGNTFGFKNRIINGAMMIDQRNAGASVTPTATAYTLDRWNAVLSVASKYSVQQATAAPAGFINSLFVTSASAYTVGASEGFSIQQRVEGLNIADLGWGTANAATITISFWVRSSLTGTFGGALKNSDSTRSYPFTYTISSANTWEQKSITIAGDTTGTWLTTSGIGINCIFSLGAGATVSGTAGSWAGANYNSATGATSVVGTNGATFYITGVQLEKGSVATPFDFRSYGTELALCQRYYYRRTSASTFDRIATLQTYSSNGAFGKMFDFPVPMRASPTANKSATGDTGLYNASGSALNAVTTQGALRTSQFGCHTDGDVSTGLTTGVTGGATTLAFNTTSGWYDFSAEL